MNAVKIVAISIISGGIFVHTHTMQWELNPR